MCIPVKSATYLAVVHCRSRWKWGAGCPPLTYHLSPISWIRGYGCPLTPCSYNECPNAGRVCDLDLSDEVTRANLLQSSLFDLLGTNSLVISSIKGYQYFSYVSSTKRHPHWHHLILFLNHWDTEIYCEICNYMYSFFNFI